MNPVFYQYHREKNILDSLIHEFAKRNWLFDEMPTNYFHQYRWPDIVLSDKKADSQVDDNSIESLGCYEPDTNRSEGRVVLFMPKIRETTIEYMRHLGHEPNNKEFKKYVELLTTLVLIHEFTHWIVQAGIFHTKKDGTLSTIPLELKYDDEDSIFFHETIAQIFTNYFCYKDAELKKMFFWLEEGQPIQYQMYKKLLCGDGVVQLVNSNQTVKHEEKLFHIEVKLDKIVKIIFSLMVLRVNERQPQSYSDLQTIYYQIWSDSIDIKPLFEHTKIEIFKRWDWNRVAFTNFQEKYKGAIVGKEYGI